MEKEKRKRSTERRFKKLPYTLIGFGIIIVTFMLGFTIGATIESLPDQALRGEWNIYATQTSSYKATHEPTLFVTQTVAVIQTQWAEINITQTAIHLEQRNQ